MSKDNARQQWCDFGSHYVSEEHILKSYGDGVCDACTLQIEQLVNAGILSEDDGGLLWWLGYDLDAIKRRRGAEFTP